MVSKNNLKSISKMLSNFMLLNKKNYIKYCDNAKKCFKENYKIDKPVQNLIELIKNEI